MLNLEKGLVNSNLFITFANVDRNNEYDEGRDNKRLELGSERNRKT